ncbi:hypothetical protein BD779DRAFT_1631677 [Infundibulicybe gibba]|nr:hypothetical protein BD779DRAFT_1631677 [Infundibulicybe gibba]
MNVLRRWLASRVIDMACDIVSDEMDDMKKSSNGPKSLKELTPSYLRTWSLDNAIAQPAQLKAPSMLKILRSAVTTSRAQAENKKKTSDTACYTIIGQLLSRRSQNNQTFSGPMSLFFWRNGCSRQTLEVLNSIGLTKSYDSTLSLIESVANYCIAEAQVAVQNPNGYLFGYDNINLSTSIFVEQRGSAPAKVQSGTHAIVYELRNSNASSIKLGPILARERTATDLDFYRDISLTAEQAKNSTHQFKSYIIRVLLRYHKGFNNYIQVPAIQNIARRRLPDGYKTRQFPLKISTIEEATIAGNIAALRAKDKNSFTRVQCFQLGIGLFHLCLNLTWAILHIHRGHMDQFGSLSHWFAILQKTRLGSPHPDYHSLLAALMQILDGLILDAWRLACGTTSLRAFAKSNPSPEDLLNIAGLILLDHATPLLIPPNPGQGIPHPDHDRAHQNVRLLIHDLLYVAEVTRAISDGDWGRVEDILPNLAMIFRGAGSKNYCVEILHFIRNMKKVWKGDGFECVDFLCLRNY